MEGVNSAREQDSSVGGDARYVCNGVVHMEEEVRVRVQVEVGREEQGEGETPGKERRRDETKRLLSMSETRCDTYHNEATNIKGTVTTTADVQHDQFAGKKKLAGTTSSDVTVFPSGSS